MAASHRRSRGDRYTSNLSSTSGMSGIVDYSYVHDASAADARNGAEYTLRKRK